MADELTARHELPLIVPGQSQKEMTHNEALTRLDMLVMPTAIAIADAPPADPAPGDCWIVGAAPADAWSGMASHLACWSVGGWRYVAPRAGMAVWLLSHDCAAVRHGDAWRIGEVAGTGFFVGGQRVVGARQPAISAPAGGENADAQARAAIDAILAALTAHGLLATP